MGVAELSAGVRTHRRELMDLRFESARSGSAPAGRIRALKADIARHLTELRRRRS
ncbi:50S ribosomal protein L29 [bacterium]|nr:50S ribosomal protein L29 [bacterium]